MQLLIAAVGRAKRSHEAELVAHYLKQTRWDVAVHEIADAPQNMAREARRGREAEALLTLMTPHARLVALDMGGANLSSPDMAKLIQTAQGQGVKRLIFAIGGQDGLHETVIARAELVLAFGTATWPHQLLRAMLAEQIYRAYSITIGHPYHLGH